MTSAADRPTVERHYTLTFSHCGKRQIDDGLVLECGEVHEPSLLRTEYSARVFDPHHGRRGLFRYEKWLPVISTQEDVGRTAVYRSEGLAAALGLPNLWIAFNGYWPERGAFLETATFKELEAYTVLGRLPGHDVTLTLASSGNTGAAFAWACSQAKRPCLVKVPGRALYRFKFRAPLHPLVNLVVIDDGDYPDAIDLAAAVTRISSLQPEGGIKNVARRDGLATVLLSAFEAIQGLPTHYFQAVGSGTGAIAVLEGAKRMSAASGGLALPRLMLCQNLPFAPIYDAWRTNIRAVNNRSTDHLRSVISKVLADELTNVAPPYEINGGLYNALTESKGDVLVAENNAISAAREMFFELECIDVEPAVGVAIACLVDAVAKKEVDSVDHLAERNWRRTAQAQRGLSPAAGGASVATHKKHARSAGNCVSGRRTVRWYHNGWRRAWGRWRIRRT